MATMPWLSCRSPTARKWEKAESSNLTQRDKPSRFRLEHLNRDVLPGESQRRNNRTGPPPAMMIGAIGFMAGRRDNLLLLKFDI